MYTDHNIFAGIGTDARICLPLSKANRHGLITGATGTGKSTTLKVLAEGFSNAGVPVFLEDVKGDISGMMEAGVEKPWMSERCKEAGIPYEPQAFPVSFWDLSGKAGTPVRVTVTDMGPVLLARLLNLSEVQEGVLSIVFHVADDNGLLLLDLKDLRSMLQYVSDHRKELTASYGNVSAQSIGAIQRALLQIEDEGADAFFGEPALDINDLFMTDSQGRGEINILSSSSIIHSPKIYSMFLMWMLSDLFEKLPEVGDTDKPKMVFFFDEAHLLFNDAPKAFVEKITQTVKLIRSKGVGIWFISQSPSDIPDSVLSQLQNRIAHAMHAYTPAEIKAVRLAASSFRPNPAFNCEQEIMNLGVGEALVSFLDERGVPSVVEKTKILAPQSKEGPADPNQMNRYISSSQLDETYRNTIDRESAFEIISEVQNEAQKQIEQEQKAAAFRKSAGRTVNRAVSSATSSITRSVSSNLVNAMSGKKTKSVEKIAQQAATNAVNQLLKGTLDYISRGIFGTRK